MLKPVGQHSQRQRLSFQKCRHTQVLQASRPPLLASDHLPHARIRL